MEFVEGKDLRSILNQARRRALRIPRPLAVRIGARLASALNYAHNHPSASGRPAGIIHRDVSPRNVLVGFDGRVKLCDFGIAKAASTVGRTQIGAIKGKLQYMSPEQAWGRPVDGRSDIFSLGVVLYELVTGERLFAGDNEISLLEEVRECKVLEPRSLDPSIPEQLNRIVVKALKKAPEERYQSAAEMQKELEALFYLMPPSDDLSQFVDRLFSEQPDAPEEAPRAIPVLTPPVLVSSSVAAGLDEESEESSSTEARRVRPEWTRWAIAAAVLAIALAIWWLAKGSRAEGPAPSAAVATPSAAEAEAPVERDAEPAGGGESGAATLSAAPGRRADAGRAAPTADASDQAIKSLVDRELARREAELRQTFRDQEERLRLELERLDQGRQQTTAAPAQPPAQEGAAPPPSPSPGGGASGR
jgi:hypothetical protein